MSRLILIPVVVIVAFGGFAIWGSSDTLTKGRAPKQAPASQLEAPINPGWPTKTGVLLAAPPLAPPPGGTSTHGKSSWPADTASTDAACTQAAAKGRASAEIRQTCPE